MQWVRLNYLLNDSYNDQHTLHYPINRLEAHVDLGVSWQKKPNRTL